MCFLSPPGIILATSMSLGLKYWTTSLGWEAKEDTPGVIFTELIGSTFLFPSGNTVNSNINTLDPVDPASQITA